ncbi:MAG: hypothetical protein K0R73_658 [Candidatus Midichloriaceae bacterium]|jgi:uncharacterized membrane protein YbhN (UPF0104 family)|nr:hypothetical protein [Candidatus Midichloriaceae bacterium]
MRKQITTALKIVFIVAALYLVFNKIDFKEAALLLKDMDPIFFGGAFICSVISMFISGIRSQHYFSEFGLTVPKKDMVKLYFAGAFLNLALPGGIGGDGYKIFHIYKHFHFSKLKAFRIVLYERVNGFYVLCIFGFIIAYFSSFIKLPYTYIINTALLVLITPCYIFGIKFVLKDKFSAALKATWYSIWVQLLQISMAWLLVHGLAHSADAYLYLDFIVLFIAASILAIIPISIGGIGVRELTFLYGLKLLNVPPHMLALGVSFALASFFVYVLTVTLGAFFFSGQLQLFKR